MSIKTNIVRSCFPENIQDRTDAAELIEFAGEHRPRFWEELIRMAGEKLPPKPESVDPNPPMQEQEALRFEQTMMPYGKHIREYVGEVPCDYLIFLTEGDEFTRKLRRYVRSKRFAERQADDE